MCALGPDTYPNGSPLEVSGLRSIQPWKVWMLEKEKQFPWRLR